MCVLIVLCLQYREAGEECGRESPAVLERRIMAELTKQQHQSREDQSWLQQEETNLVS